MTKDPQRVYCKTDKGRQEIAERCHGLAVRQRSTLILMDGAKNIAAIAAIIPLPELEKTVPFLAENGFIIHLAALRADASPSASHPRHPASRPNAASPPAPPKIAPPALTQNPEIIDKVKVFMLTSSATHLGLMGADIITRIQRCNTADQLMAAAAFWHMAFRESKSGKQFASIFLEQVKFELRNGN